MDFGFLSDCYISGTLSAAFCNLVYFPLFVNPQSYDFQFLMLLTNESDRFFNMQDLFILRRWIPRAIMMSDNSYPNGMMILN